MSYIYIKVVKYFKAWSYRIRFKYLLSVVTNFSDNIIYPEIFWLPESIQALSSICSSNPILILWICASLRRKGHDIFHNLKGHFQAVSSLQF